MTKLKAIVRELLGNGSYFKVSYLVLICFQMILFFRPICDPILKAVLVYGFLYLVYDLFTARTFWKAPYMKLLLSFLAFYAMGVVLHYQTYLWENFILFSYTVVSLLILFPINPAEDRSRMLKQLGLFCRVLSLFLFGATVISLLVYFLNINAAFSYFGKPFYIGTYQNRLWGIYPNPNTSSVLSAIGAVAPFVAKIALNFTSTRYRVFCWVNFGCQLLLIILSGSRGGELFFFGLIGVVLFFRRDKIGAVFGKRIRNSFFQYGISVVCFLVIVGVYYGLNRPLKQTLAWISYGVATLQETVEGRGEEILFEPLERKEDANTATGSGRLRLWKLGLERFIKEPLFGMTSKNLTDKIITDGRETDHIHNLYIQILGSSGVFAFLVFIIFKFLIFFRTLKYLFKEKERDQNYNLVVLLFGMAVATAIQQLVEVDELYRVESIPVIAWVLLGYLVYFLPKSKRGQVKAERKTAVV